MHKNQDLITIPGHILIVDDEIANLKLLKELLSHEGYQVRPADHPQVAIDSALAQPPALILLDVKMPEMDGFEVCRCLKQDERTREVPVIFISALHEVDDKLRGFEVGGVDYITKPFQEEEVLARVRTHMDLRNMQVNLEEMVAKRTTALENEIYERKQAEIKIKQLKIARYGKRGFSMQLPIEWVKDTGLQGTEKLVLYEEGEGRLVIKKASCAGDINLNDLVHVYEIQKCSSGYYRVTIPAKWVKESGIEPGDDIDIYRDMDDRLILVVKQEERIRQ